ncbi:aldo/keto reductase [Halalkalibacter alkalisediminis]|uniref:Aldo/keto reductase n=1 Tax=Halalkalibacter alkalisediminis TaxID=935616 RepID=A0ABV6NMD0_9BACI|nr:aldo/keto reductase [Halalkalibacter alkalisediminis]
MKLTLGTAQFGLKYGISNNDGKTPFEEVYKIIKYAESVGINTIDTAPSYGESEEVIGNIIKNHNSFKVVTKIPPLNSPEIFYKDVNKLETSVHSSLRKLKCKNIYGVMIHNISDVFKKNGDRLYYKLLDLKNRGLINKIGFSVYDSDQIDLLCNSFTFDIIQIPINVLDQRLLKSGHLRKLKNLGIEIYARSIFLQGLLLMEIENLPKNCQTIQQTLLEYHHFLEGNGISQLDGALAFVKNIKEIDYIVIGVNNLKQLVEIKKSYDTKTKANDNYKKFSCGNLDIIDPRRW